MEVRGASGSAAVQPQLRRTTGAGDFDVLPQDAPRVPGAERFHGRFLGGKSASQVRHRIATTSTIGDLLQREYTAQKPITILREQLRNAAQIGGIESDSDDVHDPA